MLGSIIGDIAGSVYEFNNYRAKDFAPFFHRNAAFTDDTVCTVAIADIIPRCRLLENLLCGLLGNDY